MAKVLYFASAKQITGVAEEEFDIPEEGQTIEALQHRILEKHPKLKTIQFLLSVAEEIEVPIDTVILPEHVEITDAPIELQKWVDMASDDTAGAVSVFLGTTRDHYNGKKVLRLEYEAYESMAIKEMHKIVAKMRTKWELVHIVFVHRIGVVPVKEASVAIVVSSVHRREAMEACTYGIDELKAHVPIWKHEFYEDGSEWKQNAEAQGHCHCTKTHDH